MKDTRERLLIVGNGMAGGRLLDELLTRGAGEQFAITVIGEEPHGEYNRIMLSRIIAGADLDEITTKPRPWYAAHGVELLSGRWVQRLDPIVGSAIIGNKETVPFDHCVLATGSSCWVPPVVGIRRSDGSWTPGVHVFRTIDDCLSLRAETDPKIGVRNVAVVGGGLLGLEIARSFVDLGHQVTVVHAGETLMDTQLDWIGGELLRKSVEAMGIRVLFGQAEAILAKQMAEALTLADGRQIPAETVVFATGTRPRIEVAAASGIEVNRGILIDRRLATTSPNVYAIGECAEFEGVTYGLVAPCWDHARILADLLTGADTEVRYQGSKIYSRLKVSGVDIASMGPIHAEHDTDEVVQVIEERRGIYRKLILRGGRIVGAVVVGDPDNTPTLVQLFDQGDQVPQNPVDIFCSVNAFVRSEPESADEACNCNRVSKETVISAIEAGSDTLELLGLTTRAGSGCGACVGRLNELLDGAINEEAVA
jgi:nitrite reductase (NADH) large subunit